MRGNDTRRNPAAGLSDAALWRRSRAVDMSEDAAETERYLDLAGLADGRLDPDDRDRIAEWLADDPVAAGDVAAARALAGRPQAVSESVIARACALVEPQRGTVMPFAPRHRNSLGLPGMARWGSLIAAMVVASWLGFTLGVDTSRSIAQIRQGGEDGFLREFLDPTAGFMRDLTEGTQT
jgi:anti-sigma factor RsiW